MTPTKSNKPKLGRNNLSAHQIEFYEEVYEPVADANSCDATGVLPKHVEALRRGLLNFKATVHRSSEAALRYDHEELVEHWPQDDKDLTSNWSLLPPDVAWYEKRYPTEDEELRRTEMVENMNKHREIAKYTLTLGNDAESGWTDFLRSSIFCKFEDPSSRRSDFECVICHIDFVLIRY
jgi:hypothetical protein